MTNNIWCPGKKVLNNGNMIFEVNEVELFKGGNKNKFEIKNKIILSLFSALDNSCNENHTEKDIFVKTYVCIGGETVWRDNNWKLVKTS